MTSTGVYGSISSARKGQFSLWNNLWFLQIKFPFKETSQLGSGAPRNAGLNRTASTLWTVWIHFPRCHALGQEDSPSYGLYPRRKKKWRRQGWGGGPEGGRSGPGSSRRRGWPREAPAAGRAEGMWAASRGLRAATIQAGTWVGSRQLSNWWQEESTYGPRSQAWKKQWPEDAPRKGTNSA